MSSNDSSQLSDDTVETLPRDARPRSPTPSSLLPRPATRSLADLAALVDGSVLERARAAVKRGAGMATLRHGDPMLQEGEAPSVFHLARGHVLEQEGVASLRATSERRELDAARLTRVLRAIGEGTPVPAIKVDARGRIVDGFHRLGAAELAGLQSVTVQGPAGRARSGGMWPPAGESRHEPVQLHKSPHPWRTKRADRK